MLQKYRKFGEMLAKCVGAAFVGILSIAVLGLWNLYAFALMGGEWLQIFTVGGTVIGISIGAASMLYGRSRAPGINDGELSIQLANDLLSFVCWLLVSLALSFLLLQFIIQTSGSGNFVKIATRKGPGFLGDVPAWISVSSFISAYIFVPAAFSLIKTGAKLFRTVDFWAKLLRPLEKPAQPERRANLRL